MRWIFASKLPHIHICNIKGFLTYMVCFHVPINLVNRSAWHATVLRGNTTRFSFSIHFLIEHNCVSWISGLSERILEWMKKTGTWKADLRTWKADLGTSKADLGTYFFQGFKTWNLVNCVCKVYLKYTILGGKKGYKNTVLVTKWKKLFYTFFWESLYSLHAT